MANLEDVKSRMLVKCGRLCCICRRFRPTLLQVHHIIEKSEGGSDDEDNLIALCITCHSSVHTQRPFTQRFTNEELKQHRNTVCALVAEGKLVPPHDDYVPAYVSVARSQKSTLGDRHISKEAAELLVAAAEGEYGWLTFMANNGGCSISAGDLQRDINDGRNRALYESAIEELASLKLLRKDRSQQGITLWQVTYSGYLSADELAVLAV